MKILNAKYSIRNSRNAYIAIVASIIITILVIALVLTTSTTGYFGRFNVLGSLTKEEGDALAEACADYALLELALDTNYAGATTTKVASTTCTILAIETNGYEKTIKTQGLNNDTITNTKVILDVTDFTIVSWDEVKGF
ncbi:MAG: hypothetical protein A3C03_02280 [Candidatus Colwellbacteria bacterium RIFCSPHIGHO2_02_FULL_45_17]|uniref:Uncharacterized protein n=2 Tax=environmental samples TaxID=221217 RepID=A0A0H4TF27_9BACT|nr:hypothetical protein [uncultured Parcubacteria bacterium Rifle_16ft_4_minimus_37647]AKQ05630.1 hypothetical protein [uncultured Parcubacteria bacterium Rifle_16ft_4_minimus_23790]OGY58532.1 MAG: hypothetical protein A3C03_02280 [Candidatus Colwellbacteria bacterium RIFCSPHIGHO2_02_FULL_45_17]